MIVPRQEVKTILYELRFKRFLKPSKHLLRYKDTCAWCGKQNPSKLKYCSDVCQREVNIRYTGSYVSSYVFERDCGICAMCGIDTEEIREHAINIKKLSWKLPNFRKQWGPWNTVNFSFWEADHIVPVFQGGGVCGLENYRTLCLLCHKKSHIQRRRIKGEI
jgi:hypothetical protein